MKNASADQEQVSVMLYVLISDIVQYIISPVRCKNDKYIKDAIIDYYRGNMGRKDDL